MRMIDTVQAHDVTSMHCGGTIERIYEPENTQEIEELRTEISNIVPDLPKIA